MDAIEKGLQRLRKAQAKRVSEHVGPLLDAWEGMPNDVKGFIEEQE